MKKFVLLSVLAIEMVLGSSLVTSQAVVKAHTEVFGDSTIDPETRSLTSHLKMDGTIESIRGSVDVNILKLKSDNEKRDEHMVDALESKKYPVATYTFSQVQKQGAGYLIDGVLEFHGVKRPLKMRADIQQSGEHVHIKAKGYIKLSEYRVKPIKMFFLEVRDRIDLKVDATFRKQ